MRIKQLEDMYHIEYSEKQKEAYQELTDKMKKDSIGELKCIFKCLEKASVCTKPSSC